MSSHGHKNISASITADSINLQGSGNLNASIKKGGSSTGKASGTGGIRASTGRSNDRGVHGAENTKGSSSSQVVRKSSTGGAASSQRKAGTRNYINRNNLIDS